MPDRVNHEWRCTDCRALIGVEHRAGLYLRYKQAQFVVGGDYTVTAICPRCSSLNERSPPKGQPELTRN